MLDATQQVVLGKGHRPLAHVRGFSNPSNTMDCLRGALQGDYRKLSRLSNIVLGNSLGGRTELLNYERS